MCFDRCKTLLLLLLSQINTQYTTTHDVEKINTKQALSAVVVQINVKKLLISNTRKMHYLHLFSRQGAFFRCMLFLLFECSRESNVHVLFEHLYVPFVIRLRWTFTMKIGLVGLGTYLFRTFLNFLYCCIRGTYIDYFVIFFYENVQYILHCKCFHLELIFSLLQVYSLYFSLYIIITVYVLGSSVIRLPTLWIEQKNWN